MNLDDLGGYSYADFVGKVVSITDGDTIKVLLDIWPSSTTALTSMRPSGVQRAHFTFRDITKAYFLI